MNEQEKLNKKYEIYYSIDADIIPGNIEYLIEIIIELEERIEVLENGRTENNTAE